MLSALPIVSLGNSAAACGSSAAVSCAAYLDQQNDPTPITPRTRRAAPGCCAGIIGAVVWLIVSVVLNALDGAPSRAVRGRVRTNGTRHTARSVRAMLESFGAGSSFRFVFGFVVFSSSWVRSSPRSAVCSVRPFSAAMCRPHSGGPMMPPPLPPQ